MPGYKQIMEEMGILEKKKKKFRPIFFYCPICSKPALNCNKEEFNCNRCESNEDDKAPCRLPEKEYCNCKPGELIEALVTENLELKQRISELEEAFEHEAFRWDKYWEERN